MPYKIDWYTDIHLDHLEEGPRQAFLKKMVATKSNAIVLTGDIARGDIIKDILTWLEEHAKQEIFFVFGNHDYYLSGIEALRTGLRDLAWAPGADHLRWLTISNPLLVHGKVVILGDDGWYDGSTGDFMDKRMKVNDWEHIQEFRGLERAYIKGACQKLAFEASERLREKLKWAFDYYEADHVLCLLHFPPFTGFTDERWEPFTSSTLIADALRESMAGREGKTLSVLSGHVHRPGRMVIDGNIEVLTGGAKYGEPKLQTTITIPD
jgi:Icc protein